MGSPFNIGTSHGLALEEDDAVGIARIDGQHRLLIGLFNNMLGNIGGEVDENRRFHVFTELFSYANYHFSSEEQLMRQALYPEYRAHLFEHRNLISTFELLGRRVRQRDDGAMMLAKVIGQWLLCHIRIADKDLGWYLAADSALDALGPAIAVTTTGHAEETASPCFTG
jgi:hemerythrin-like metal-binding protein